MPTAPPVLTDAPASPDRADRATFTGRSIALDNWRKNQNVPEMRTALANVYANALELINNASLVQSDRILVQSAAAAVAAQSPVANAAAAAAAALAAQGYATLAQATNPDSPVRLNPRRITANLMIPNGYNAVSVGPIVISDDVDVVVQDNANWSII